MSARPTVSVSRGLHTLQCHAFFARSPCRAFPVSRTRLPSSYRSASSPASRVESHRPAQNPDRGPTSKENTQTDFTALDVLGAVPAPSTSIDVCTTDGFILDSSLRITDGDGVMLIGGEAFVWRPWITAPADRSPSQILKGIDIRNIGNATGGLINAQGLFEIPSSSLGPLNLVWPKPDLFIIGTGEKIHPLGKKTREMLQQLGVRIEVLDTRNAASQFNMLATERGVHEVAAAILPVGFVKKNLRG